MKSQLTTLFVAGSAQDASPQIRPAEFFPCTFNEGKDMGDLEKVIARWNAFTDDNDADTGYQAWLLMPDFVSGDHAGWDIGWLGGRPSGADMGKSLDIWHTKGGELQRAFADVVTCAAHMNYAVMPMREAGGEPPHWVFVPAYGAPVDADYDFKWVTGYRDYAAFGEDWDAYANEGG